MIRCLFFLIWCLMPLFPTLLSTLTVPRRQVAQANHTADALRQVMSAPTVPVMERPCDIMVFTQKIMIKRTTGEPVCCLCDTQLTELTDSKDIEAW